MVLPQNAGAAQARNPHPPVPAVRAFPSSLALRDLKENATLEGLAPYLREGIEQAQRRRASAAQDRERSGAVRRR
jgi:hypothetical protein